MSAHRDLKNAQAELNEAVAAWLPQARIGPPHPYDHDGQAKWMAQQSRIIHAYDAWDALRRNLDTAGAASARQTSIVAGVTSIPNKGTLRRNILAAVISHESQYHVGMNVAQLKAQLRKEHSSVSSAINALEVRSLIKDSGVKRKTQYNKDAIVWVATDDAKRIYAEALCQPA